MEFININQNTNIDFNLEFLSNDSKMINFSNKAIYAIFWNSEKQKLGKFILKFNDEMSKNIFLDCIIEIIYFLMFSFIKLYKFLGIIVDFLLYNY